MLKERKIDINRIDDFGVYKSESGKTMQLTDDQILALRIYYKTNDIAKKTKVHRVDTINQEVIFNQANIVKGDNIRKNNLVKFKLEKVNKVLNFKTIKDINKIINKGKAFFMAGVVVFVSTVTSTNILAQSSDAKKQEKEDTAIVTEASEPIVAAVAEAERKAKKEKEKETIIIEDSKVPKAASMQVETKDIDVEKYFSVYNDLGSSIIEASDILDRVRETEQQRIIKMYCDVYNVNYDIVYDKIVKLTDNFTSSEYLSGTITGVTCKGKQVQCDKEEELLLLTVRNIKQMPENYGFEYGEIAIPVKKPTLGVDNIYTSEIICDEYHERMSYYADLFDIDKCLVHALVQSESGFNSRRFVEDHNPAGLTAGGKFRIFSSDEEGLIEVCTEVVKYRDRGYVTIPEIGQEYVQGDQYYEWVEEVTNAYNNAHMNEELLFGMNESKNMQMR